MHTATSGISREILAVGWDGVAAIKKKKRRRKYMEKRHIKIWNGIFEIINIDRSTHTAAAELS